MQKNTELDVLSRLSPRESEVMSHVVEGKTAREIAAIIGVKPSTIQTYRSRIMTKLDTRNVVDLVRLAIRHGVIRP